MSVFCMREHIEFAQIPRNKVEQSIEYFFWQITCRAILLLILGCLDNIQIFPDSRKLRILVFYMREHMELVYILQNKVEEGIVYFFSQIIFKAIMHLTLVCLDNIQIFFDSSKIRILLFYMREHIVLLYIPQNRVE